MTQTTQAQKRLHLHTLLLVVLMICSLGEAKAQRLLPKQGGITLLGSTTGISQKGLFEPKAYAITAELSQYLRRFNYWFVGGEYRQRQNCTYARYSIPVQEYLLQLGYMHPILVDARKTLLIYGGLSATGGYQEINKGINRLSNGAVIVSRSRFVYGCTPQVSLELLLTDNFILQLRGKGMFLWGSDLNLFYPSLGGGIKINF